MQDWLASGLESLDFGLPGRVVDIHSMPAEVLERPDIGLCLTSGVTVVMGKTPIGYVPGPKLSRMLADISRRSHREAQSAREETKRLRRDRRMLAANLSHELRTAVNAISGYSELVALGLATGRTVSAAGQNAVIWEAAQSLLGTIDAILDVARIEAGAAQLDESEFSIASLVRVVERMLATLADARRVTFRIEVADDLPPLFADARMIRQVLVNLVGNAIKYGGEGGEVAISASIDRHERMSLEVRDTGGGMSEGLIASAMQPFRRCVAEKGALPGSGLGLPLVKVLVELHEGRFRLRSATGKGTRAIVTLPAGRVRIPRLGRQEAFAFQRSSDLFA